VPNPYEAVGYHATNAFLPSRWTWTRESTCVLADMDSDEDAQMIDTEPLALPSFAKGKGKATDRLNYEDDSLPWYVTRNFHQFCHQDFLQGGKV
jgi:hypothetical protein